MANIDFCCWKEPLEEEWMVFLEVNGQLVHFVQRSFPRIYQDRICMSGQFRCFLDKDSIIKLWFVPMAGNPPCSRKKTFVIRSLSTNMTIERVRQFE